LIFTVLCKNFGAPKPEQQWGVVCAEMMALKIAESGS
jgi:hypothetical protein